MMDDEENGKIGVCIYERLTRWGATISKSETRWEDIQTNVRFIAVNNGSIDIARNLTHWSLRPYQYHVGVVCKGHQQESERH